MGSYNQLFHLLNGWISCTFDLKAICLFEPREHKEAHHFMGIFYKSFSFDLRYGTSKILWCYFWSICTGLHFLIKRSPAQIWIFTRFKRLWVRAKTESQAPSCNIMKKCTTRWKVNNPHNLIPKLWGQASEKSWTSNSWKLWTDNTLNPVDNEYNVLRWCVSQETSLNTFWNRDNSLYWIDEYAKSPDYLLITI